MTGSTEDAPDEGEFRYLSSKDGRVFLYHRGRQVVVLTGRTAMRFLARAEHATERQVQLLMAKATRNFKRGNERRT